MKKNILLSILVVLLMVTSGQAFQVPAPNPEDVSQSTVDGSINWSKGIISAVGYAAAGQDAYSQKVAAGAVARANLLKVLGDLNIKAGITVNKGLATKNLVQNEIVGTLSGSFLGKPVRNPDGTMSVTAYKYITRQMLEQLMPSAFFQGEANHRDYAPAPGNAPANSPVPASSATPYSGLIIDARGLKVMPSLGFNILVEDSDEVLYGLATASRMAVIDKGGMADYTGTIEAARANPRVGKTPLVVKAAKGRDTDLVISKDDAAAIYRDNLQTSFLKELKVVVVCGG